MDNILIIVLLIIAMITSLVTTSTLVYITTHNFESSYDIIYINQTSDCIDEAIRTLDKADEIKERVWNYDRYK